LQLILTPDLIGLIPGGDFRKDEMVALRASDVLSRQGKRGGFEKA
jgi:hypothetical protein